ncbi:hypothetical protein H7X46_11710 [Pseudonocardia sp. C8]|uniref:hypothetical protein n=1 Tax=Pseudonocardia sp. C8 TaxID=2762759 RepID=UPI001643131E|nr:hypothetical protein [Pseudonocardia sp. C8]MBC3191728.1 hypothetical protein [Pseudonocardia sp. C8]
MTAKTTEDLARHWLRALEDVDLFYEFCDPGCRVWHSADNAWMSLDDAIRAVHDRGGLPEFTGSRYTLTETGFVVQTSGRLEPPGVTVHLVQIATVENGRVVRAEEYIGPEMDIAV